MSVHGPGKQDQNPSKLRVYIPESNLVIKQKDCRIFFLINILSRLTRAELTVLFLQAALFLACRSDKLRPLSRLTCVASAGKQSETHAHYGTLERCVH